MMKTGKELQIWCEMKKMCAQEENQCIIDKTFFIKHS